MPASSPLLGRLLAIALLVALLHDFEMVLLARIVGGVLAAGLMVAPMAIVPIAIMITT